MSEQAPKPSSSPPLASVEADFCGTIFGFFTRTISLLRESSLDGDQRKIVAERIHSLIDNATVEMKQTKQLDLTKPLQAAYDEIKRLIEELSAEADDGN